MAPAEHPAKKIKFLLRTGNTTVQVLSDKVGITLESLRDILDEREMPTANLLYRICNFFGVKENFFDECLRPGGKAPPAPPPRETLKSSPVDSVPDLFPKPPPVPSAAPEGKRRGARLGKLRPGRKLDFAELAARQSVLVELLISKGVFSKDEFDTRLEILRARVLARKQSVQKSR